MSHGQNHPWSFRGPMEYGLINPKIWSFWIFEMSIRHLRVEQLAGQAEIPRKPSGGGRFVSEGQRSVGREPDGFGVPFKGKMVFQPFPGQVPCETAGRSSACGSAWFVVGLLVALFGWLIHSWFGWLKAAFAGERTNTEAIRQMA